MNGWMDPHIVLRLCPLPRPLEKQTRMFFTRLSHVPLYKNTQGKCARAQEAVRRSGCSLALDLFCSNFLMILMFCELIFFYILLLLCLKSSKNGF